MNFRPVFIGGCDRSGTTLLGDLLGATNWTVVTPESQFFHEILLLLKLKAFNNSDDAAEWMHNHFRFAAWELDLDVQTLSEIIKLDNPRATVETIIQYYLNQAHPYKINADVWVDHTPDNFKYHSALKTLFPEARFIHIVRDGRAVSSSLKNLDWGPNNAYSASRHWAERMEQALNVEVAEGDNCFRLHFEQLVSKPEVVLPELCKFIDIPFDSEMLNGGGLLLPSFTRKQHIMVGQAPQKQAAHAWRKNMSTQDMRDFESYPFSRLLLEKMKYPLEFDDAPRLSRARILNRYLHEFTHNILNRMKHRKMERDVVKAYQLDCKRKSTDKTAQQIDDNSSLLESYK